MGDLVIGPFLLAYFSPRAFEIVKRRYVEGGLLLSLTFAASIGIFTNAPHSLIAQPYFLFLLMAWVAIRFTQIGVVTCVVIVASVGLWATANGMGPYVGDGSQPLDLLGLQLFVCVLSATSLMIAMAITERLSVEDTLMIQAHELGRLDAELKEANKRVTNILAEILDDGPTRHHNSDD
jgi:integral membrane sensor domain MASE1